MTLLKNKSYISTQKLIFLAIFLSLCSLTYMILMYQHTYVKYTVKNTTLHDEKILRGTIVNLLSLPPTPSASSGKYVDINAYPYIINEPNKCKDKNPILVILIATVATEAEHRVAIRSTYGNVTSKTGIPIISLFLLGSVDSVYKDKILEESEKYHDIIQKDFQDTYRNLTIKTMMGIDWVSKYCPKTAYVMKTDSDMFVNTERLLKLFEEDHTPKENYFTGFLLLNHRPHRNEDSKWHMPYSLYPDEFYPNFSSGTGYVFSGDVAPKILRASFKAKFVYLEDVFVGICLDKEGVPVVAPPINNLFNNDLVPFDPCVYNNIITSHYMTPNRLITFWKTMQEHKDRCTKLT